MSRTDWLEVQYCHHTNVPTVYSSSTVMNEQLHGLYHMPSLKMDPCFDQSNNATSATHSHLPMHIAMSTITNATHAPAAAESQQPRVFSCSVAHCTGPCQALRMPGAVTMWHLRRCFATLLAPPLCCWASFQVPGMRFVRVMPADILQGWGTHRQSPVFQAGQPAAVWKHRIWRVPELGQEQRLQPLRLQIQRL